MDWSSFTKGYFLNRDTLVAVLLLIDASVPPQKIDLDCANWLGRNEVFNIFTLRLALLSITSFKFTVIGAWLKWVDFLASLAVNLRYQLHLSSPNATR